MPHELVHEGYVISDDPGRLDVTAIHAYLARSYWATDIPFAVVQRSLAHSLGFGVYAPDKTQVGLARVISDYTTFAYLCDVYILEAHRGQGLSRALMRAVTTHPELQGLRRFNLVTLDAHGVYAPFGFAPAAHPERYMEKLDRDVYRQPIEARGTTATPP